MAGSLLVCQEIKVSRDELKKLTGGSFISPGDLSPVAPDATGTNDKAKRLAEALEASQARAERAHEAEVRAKTVSTVVTVGSLLIAATGLYLTWSSRSR